jgi:hypothetical protein
MHSPPPAQHSEPAGPGGEAADQLYQYRTSVAGDPGSRPAGRHASTTPVPRLPDGAWRILIRAHLQAFPHTDFSPAELANALGRPGSRGAVINACRRLVADGAAQLTSQRPQRFQAAPTGADTHVAQP